MANFSNITNATIVNKSFNQESKPTDKKIQMTEKVNTTTSDQPLSKDKSKNDNWDKARTVATILAFLTAVVGIITKIMDIW